ncbi:unnamed protein product [Rhizophagus irregularis]|nr:unnamed protein product [Rhizophagus irregularis]
MPELPKEYQRWENIVKKMCHLKAEERCNIGSVEIIMGKLYKRRSESQSSVSTLQSFKSEQLPHFSISQFKDTEPESAPFEFTADITNNSNNRNQVEFEDEKEDQIDQNNAVNSIIGSKSYEGTLYHCNGSSNGGDNNSDSSTDNYSNSNNGGDGGDGVDGGNGGNGGNGNRKNSKDKFIDVSSEVKAKINDQNIFQSFKIDVKLFANITTDDILNLKIDVHECSMGNMISKNCTALKRLGNGYFLDSVKINASSIYNNNYIRFKLKERYPYPENQEIKYSGGYGNKLEISKELFKAERSETYSTEYMTKRWDLRCNSENGIEWKWKYNGNKFIHEVNKKLFFTPKEHGIKWKILENSENSNFGKCKDFKNCGFCIKITQVLHFEFKNFYKYFPHKIQLVSCPTIAHSFTISFNSLADFNKKFINLKEDHIIESEYIISNNCIFNKNNIKRYT